MKRVLTNVKTSKLLLVIIQKLTTNIEVFIKDFIKPVILQLMRIEALNQRITVLENNNPKDIKILEDWVRQLKTIVQKKMDHYSCPGSYQLRCKGR